MACRRMLYSPVLVGGARHTDRHRPISSCPNPKPMVGAYHADEAHADCDHDEPLQLLRREAGEGGEEDHRAAEHLVDGDGREDEADVVEHRADHVEQGGQHAQHRRPSRRRLLTQGHVSCAARSLPTSSLALLHPPPYRPREQLTQEAPQPLEEWVAEVSRVAGEALSLGQVHELSRERVDGPTDERRGLNGEDHTPREVVGGRHGPRDASAPARGGTLLGQCGRAGAALKSSAGWGLFWTKFGLRSAGI
eukprot:scaffold8850_cov72-Phaeocystis_antarctica.AAC.3